MLAGSQGVKIPFGSQEIRLLVLQGENDMPTPQGIGPKCSTPWRLTRPIPTGAKVRCAYCGTVFRARGKIVSNVASREFAEFDQEEEAGRDLSPKVKRRREKQLSPPDTIISYIGFAIRVGAAWLEAVQVYERPVLARQ